MTTPRPRRQRATGVVLAGAVVGTCLLGAGTPALAVAAPTPSAGGLTDADARAGAVTAIVPDRTGRPTFVEVVAPTVAEAKREAAELPGSAGVALDTPVRMAVTNDPLRSRQWSLNALRVDSLPTVSHARDVVAVLDTGVRATHEDFAPGQVLCAQGADFTGDGLSTDGCVDPQGHGTHVAGIIAAVAGNGKGVGSVAPGTSILPVRVLDSTGSGGSVAIAKGIVHAVDRGARVINLSLGGGPSSAFDTAVRYATDHGVLLVAAAGNNRTTGNTVSYPAALPAVLSVASTDSSNQSSGFSYSGPTVDVAAPGGSILSLGRSSDTAYAFMSGTSMAAPAAAAVASRYRAARPTLSPAQVHAALVGTAVDLEAPGRDPNTGAGLVDPVRLLTAPTAPAPAPTAPAPAPTAPAPAPTAPAPTAPAPTTATAPATPLGVQATAGDRRVAVRWTAVASTSRAPVGSYSVERNGVPLARTTTAAFTDTAVRNGTRYSYRVRALGPGGVSGASATVSAVPTAVRARVRMASAPVRPGQAVSLQLSDFRPGSVGTVTQAYATPQRVAVRSTVVRDGRRITTTSYATRTVTRSVALGGFRVAADGTAVLSVRPVRVAAARLLVHGWERGGARHTWSSDLRTS